MNNNKGFAVSTMLYGLSIMGFLIVVLLMSIMSNNRVNTKELVKKTEEELNRFARTNVTMTASGEYVVPLGGDGYYKFELFGKNYKTFVVWLDGGTKLSVDLTSTDTNLKVPDGSTTLVTTADENTTFAQSGLIRTNMVDEDGNYIYVYVPSEKNTIGRKYLDINIIKAVNLIPKAIIKKVSTTQNNDKYVKQISPIESTFASGNFYIISNDDSSTPNLALTLVGNMKINDKDEEGIVSFRPFTGDKNQQWTIQRVNASGNTYHTITNSFAGTALEVATETINDEDTDGDIVAKHNIDNETEYMKWILSSKNTTVSTKIKNMIIASKWVKDATTNNPAYLTMKKVTGGQVATTYGSTTDADGKHKCSYTFINVD